MTFNEFLQANRLPPFGAKLMTPSGNIVTLVRYEFEANYEHAVVEVRFGVEIYWEFSQVAQCTWWKKDEEKNE